MDKLFSIGIAGRADEKLGHPEDYPKPAYTARGIAVKWDMAHTIEEKKKLLNRVRRIRGQVEAIERELNGEAECTTVLHNISACRGAMDALMAEVIEGHIRYHILDAKHQTEDQTRAADDLVDALRSYLR
jgi:DNA-binding FrmR family transcriptional regulator